MPSMIVIHTLIGIVYIEIIEISVQHFDASGVPLERAVFFDGHRRGDR